MEYSSNRAPALVWAAVAVQALGGALLGAAAAYIGGMIGLRFFAGDPQGFGDIVAQITGMLLGYPPGVALGVWLVGRAFHRDGSWVGAISGSVIGALLPLLFALAGLRNQPLLLWAVFFTCALAGSVIGFYWRAWSRR